MPAITLATAMVAAVIATGAAFLTVYSGLDDETWQVLLCLYFLALLPVSGWVFRPKRRQ